MKKTTVYYLLEFTCIVLLIISIILCKKLNTDENLDWILIIPCAVLCVPMFILEWRRQHFQKKENQQKEEDSKKKFLEKLTSRQNESAALQVMYQIVTGACLEINPLLTKYDLTIDNDYDDEDHILELEIHSANIKGKRIYFSALSSDTEMLLEDKEINVFDMDETEIISTWVADIEKFFSEINQK